MSADKAKCPLCEGDGSYVETIGDGSVKIECAMCEGTGRIAKKRKPHEGPRSDQRMVGRRKLEPCVSETKRWAVEGTCFGLNWIEVERASHAKKKAALADMRAIAKRMPHLQLRVVVVVERRDVVARSGAKPPNDSSSGTAD